MSLAEASFHAFLKAVWEENIKSKPYISCPINFRKKLRLGSHNLSVEFEINKNTKYLITVIENKQEVLTLNNNIVTFHNFSSQTLNSQSFNMQSFTLPTSRHSVWSAWSCLNIWIWLLCLALMWELNCQLPLNGEK